MEHVTPEILKRICQSVSGHDEAAAVETMDWQLPEDSAENYCSDIIRLGLSLRLRSGRLVTKRIVLKVFLKQLKIEQFNEMKQFFANEVTMYEKILTNLEKLAVMHNLNDPRLCANCYFASTDVVIMDDLIAEGFAVPRRHGGLSPDDSAAVLRTLGRLHALSVVARDRRLIDPLLIRPVYTWALVGNFTSNYIRRSFVVVADIVSHWGHHWKDAGEKIKAYSNNISEIIQKLFMEEVDLRVVNHGDAWINNILIKYDKNRKVQSIRLVDYQNATYNSLGWDLVYFLYTSLQGDVMRQHYDTLIDAYRHSLADTLDRLGADPTVAPSADAVKADVRRLLPFCLTMSCTVAAIVFNTSEEPMNVDDLVNDDRKLRSIFTSDTWVSTMKAHIRYYQDNGLL